MTRLTQPPKTTLNFNASGLSGSGPNASPLLLYITVVASSATRTWNTPEAIRISFRVFSPYSFALRSGAWPLMNCPALDKSVMPSTVCVCCSANLRSFTIRVVAHRVRFGAVGTAISSDAGSCSRSFSR